jgi:hypothetical protein
MRLKLLVARPNPFVSCDIGKGRGMAKRRKIAGEEATGPRSAADKVAGLLALIAIKDMKPDVAALKLNAIGFSSHEISDLLDVDSNYVNMVRHRKKSGAKKKTRKKRG